MTPYRRLEDGRHGHWMRQSELSNYVGMCPESVRRNRVQAEAGIDRREGDAAAIGTAVHAGIEYAVNELYVGGRAHVGDMRRLAHLEFARIAAMPTFTRASYKDDAACAKLIDEALGKFCDQVMDELWPEGSEIEFKNLVLFEDRERVVFLNGTIDYLDANMGIVDWKTASRAYQPWEKQRWAVQPRAYTWAARQLGLLPERGEMPFTYIVMIHGKPEIQRIPIQVDELQHRWLKQQALQMAKTVEANLDEWTLNDAGWWCHPKWCEHALSCKWQLYAA